MPSQQAIVIGGGRRDCVVCKDLENEPNWVTCCNCKKEWDYRGPDIRARCPSCRTTVVVKPHEWADVLAAKAKHLGKKQIKCECGYEWWARQRSYRIRCTNCGRSIRQREPRPFKDRPTRLFKCKHCGNERLTTQIHKNSIACSQCKKTTWVGWAPKIEKPGIKMCCLDCQHTWSYNGRRSQTECPGCYRHRILLKQIPRVRKDKPTRMLKCSHCEGMFQTTSIIATYIRCQICRKNFKIGKRLHASPGVNTTLLLYTLKSANMTLIELAEVTKITYNVVVTTLKQNLLIKNLIKRKKIPNPNFGQHSSVKTIWQYSITEKGRVWLEKNKG